MTFQKCNVESSRKYTSDDVFFSINRFNGGYLSAGFRNLLGKVDFLDIEYDQEINSLRFKVSNEGTGVKAGQFKLASEIRQGMFSLGRHRGSSARFLVTLNEDGWWYLTYPIKR